MNLSSSAVIVSREFISSIPMPAACFSDTMYMTDKTFLQYYITSFLCAGNGAFFADGAGY